MYYVYILHSQQDDGYYIGYSARPMRRLSEHQGGEVDATKHRLPVELIYLEGYMEQSQALEREKSLKRFGSAYSSLIKRLGKKT